MQEKNLNCMEQQQQKGQGAQSIKTYNNLIHVHPYVDEEYTQSTGTILDNRHAFWRY